MTAKVFISFNSSDREMAEGVARSLARNGVDSWFDSGRPMAGSDWVEQLRTQLHASDAVVAIIPGESADSSYVDFELGAAKALNKPILIVAHGVIDQEIYSGLSATPQFDADNLSADEIASTIHQRLASHRA